MKIKKAVIIQCRLSSSRLPQKALKELNGITVLDWVLMSMSKVKANKYYVATDESSYEALKPICDRNKFEIFAGDLNNVLKRYCDLIEKIKVDVVIRATADNPFLFHEAAQNSVDEFERRMLNGEKIDYLTYSGLPHGSGVEVFKAESLLDSAKNNPSDYEKEHVGPALYKHPEKYKCEFLKAPARFYYPDLRTTIDTYSDYLRSISIVKFILGENKPTNPFSAEQIIQTSYTKKVAHPTIYVPCVKKGYGTGHLRRCLKAASDSDVFVYIPSDCTLAEVKDLLAEYKEKGLKDWQVIEELPDDTLKPNLVTDLFSLEKEDLTTYGNNKNFIGIDEGSSFSDYFDYLVDIIPSYNLTRSANCTDTGFIEKPLNVRNHCDNDFKKILICLGGEDPAGLTIPATNLLAEILPTSEISAIICDKNLSQYNFSSPKIKYISLIQNLKEHLSEYDLVVTHYGLTAFESLFAGCAVVLLATTKLHENLAEKYNFAYVPYNKLNLKTMRDALISQKVYPQISMSIENKSLGLFLKKLSDGERLNCPICRVSPAKPDSIVERTLTKTYRRCQNCGLVYLSWTVEAEKNYEKAYFFEDYKKQYGKTYQEDFDSIKENCLKRVDVIKSLKRERDVLVLDIGCAYGPFLSAASDKGLNPFGTDISEDAVDFVKKELHFPATCAAFPNIDTEKEFGITKFDIVTMWYVIEHFKDLDSVLKKVKKIIKNNGIFAFSTPCGEGISAKSDKNNFYHTSPSDHYSVWEPSKAAKILKKYGFNIVKIVSTGHHPERFPIIKKSNSKPGSLKWEFVKKLSKAQKLGDTVEIYTKYEKKIGDKE